ncbi:uncharacterized protein [Apostichopus japonicus]
MLRALHLVRKKRWAVRKAAIICGVPRSSLYDKVTGRSKVGVQHGAPTLFTKEEEKLLADHVKYFAKIGYPLGRKGFLRLATNSAIFAGKKHDGGRLITDAWLQRYLKRWPELKLAKPQKLGIKRAQAMSRETVDSYFNELETIMNRYSLTDKPHLIFNIDETVFQTDLRSLNTITSERGALTTVLATSNATGNALPPFFIYKEKPLMDELKEGAYPGSKFHMSESGWSNGDIFQTYLEEHFLKFIPNRDSDQHVLLLYDGYNSNISVPLIEIAKSHNIILFVLPPHTSHVLQPLDKGIFSPLKSHYNSECESYMRENPGEKITRYNMTKLVSQSYAKAFSPSNLFTAFKSTGIFPTNRNILSEAHFSIAENLKKTTASQKVQKPASTKSNKEVPGNLHVAGNLQSQPPAPQPIPNQLKAKRKYKSYRPGDVANTEDRILLKIRKVVNDKEKSTKSKRCKGKSK